MRRGATVRHVFNMLSIKNPKAIQVTYKQDNQIVLQKQMDEIEVYILLYKNMILNSQGEVIISPESTADIKVKSDNIIITSPKVYVEDRCMYFAEESGAYPGTGLLVTLTQEETLKFKVDNFATVQVRVIMEDDTALVSRVMKFKVYDCLDENILPIDQYRPRI